MSIQIPETLSKNPEWADWIAELPDIVTTCAKRWNLRIGAPLTEAYAQMSYCYIAPATRSDGTEVILKIGSPSQRQGNESRECLALQLCNGHGAVKLLDHDKELGTLMLERALPGTPLGMYPDDEENTRIAAHMMKVFRRPVPSEHNFRPTVYEIDGFTRLRERSNGTTDPLPEKWVVRAERLYDELMATSTETVLLHSDLHHWNILSAEREPWLIIDPKGYFGDPGYEVGAFLANYPDASCEGRDRKEIDIRRTEILTEELDIPRERIIKWGIVLAVIWARWDVDSPEESWRESIRRAEVLDSLL
ncbi:MAG: phosphotransferase [bacterium]|nr:phosphotransferase [bacterium]